MKLHDEIKAYRDELAQVKRRLAVLERRDELRVDADPVVIQAVRDKVREASWRFGCEPWEIDGNGRARQISRARQWVMFEVRERGFSYPEIGKAMGRDHTTIISGCVEERIRRAKPLPDNDDSGKIEAGQSAVDAAPGPDRNRSTMEVRDAS